MGFDHDEPISNDSPRPAFADIVATSLSRRRLLAGGLVAAGAALLGPAVRTGASPAVAQERLLGFTGVPISTADAVTVPPGYTAEVLYAWGDPISAGPAFKRGRKQQRSRTSSPRRACTTTACTSSRCPRAARAPTHGLLAVNHEYTDDGLLHPGGMQPWTAEKVAEEPGRPRRLGGRGAPGRREVERRAAVALRAAGSPPTRR